MIVSQTVELGARRRCLEKQNLFIDPYVFFVCLTHARFFLMSASTDYIRAKRASRRAGTRTPAQSARHIMEIRPSSSALELGGKLGRVGTDRLMKS